MASAFWTLEDGRGFARRWTGMAYMLELITDELESIEGAREFYTYLEGFVYREENGEDPMALNHMLEVKIATNEKCGPGWQ